MVNMRKTSRIEDWWIAPKLNELRFVNIFSPNALKQELLVVGHMKDEDNRELWTSTNRVVEITSSGVVTAQGTIYPFKEAHALYLQFLIEINKPNTVHAFLWDYASPAKNRITADIEVFGYEKSNVSFDCKIDEKLKSFPCAYSTELKSNVVFSPFSRRNFCIRIGIPAEIISATYKTAKLTDEEYRAKKKQIKAIQRDMMKLK